MTEHTEDRHTHNVKVRGFGLENSTTQRQECGKNEIIQWMLHNFRKSLHFVENNKYNDIGWKWFVG